MAKHLIHSTQQETMQAHLLVMSSSTMYLFTISSTIQQISKLRAKSTDGNAGEPLTIEAYIGVKGDTDLNNIVDSRDSSAILTYYANIMTVNYTPETRQLSTSKLVTGPDDKLDNLAALLADVNANEWAEDNWKLTRADRTNLETGAAIDYS